MQRPSFVRGRTANECVRADDGHSEGEPHTDKHRPLAKAANAANAANRTGTPNSTGTTNSTNTIVSSLRTTILLRFSPLPPVTEDMSYVALQTR